MQRRAAEGGEQTQVDGVRVVGDVCSATLFSERGGVYQSVCPPLVDGVRVVRVGSRECRECRSGSERVTLRRRGRGADAGRVRKVAEILEFMSM